MAQEVWLFQTHLEWQELLGYIHIISLERAYPEQENVAYTTLQGIGLANFFSGTL